MEKERDGTEQEILLKYRSFALNSISGVDCGRATRIECRRSRTREKKTVSLSLFLFHSSLHKSCWLWNDVLLIKLYLDVTTSAPINSFRKTDFLALLCFFLNALGNADEHRQRIKISRSARLATRQLNLFFSYSSFPSEKCHGKVADAALRVALQLARSPKTTRKLNFLTIRIFRS